MNVHTNIFTSTTQAFSLKTLDLIPDISRAKQQDLCAVERHYVRDQCAHVYASDLVI